MSKKLIETNNNRKKQENQKRIQIAQKAIELEQSNPNRGKCFIIYNNQCYIANTNKTLKNVSLNAHEIATQLSVMQLMAISPVTYYMMYETAYQEQEKINKWIMDNYANIKIALYNCKSPITTLKIEGMRLLGHISQEFEKEFSK